MASQQRVGRPALVATILSLLLMACGQEAAPGDGDGAVATPAPTGDGTATGTEGQETVTIVGVDHAYEGVPASVATGIELTFTNESDAEAHELVLVRLPEAEERTVEELLQMTPEEQEELLMDSLVGVSVARPGEDGTVVEGDLVVDEPGRYFMLCLVPTGADPDEFMDAAAESQGPPQVEGGPPHVVQGMYAEFTAE